MRTHRAHDGRARVHAREGRANVCAATPRRGSLLYNKRKQTWRAAVSAAAIAASAAVGVVEQYKRIAAQPAKHKGKEDPEPAPEA